MQLNKNINLENQNNLNQKSPLNFPGISTLANEQLMNQINNLLKQQEERHQKEISELSSQIQDLKITIKDVKIEFQSQIIILKDDISKQNHQLLDLQNQNSNLKSQISHLEQSSNISQLQQSNTKNKIKNNNQNEQNKNEEKNYMDLIMNPQIHKNEQPIQEKEQKSCNQNNFEPKKIDVQQQLGKNDNILNQLNESTVNEFQQFASDLENKVTKQPQNQNNQTNQTYFAEEIKSVSKQQCKNNNYSWIPLIEIDIELEKHLENYIKQKELSLKYISSREYFCERRFSRGEVRHMQKDPNFKFTNVKKIHFKTLQTEVVNLAYIEQQLQKK